MINDTVQNIMGKLIFEIFDLFERKLKELIEQKHLYQSVKIDISELDILISSYGYCDFFGHNFTYGSTNMNEAEVIEKIKTIENTERNNIKEFLKNFIELPWSFVITNENTNAHYGQEIHNIKELIIPLPTIKINCNNCDSILPPHNPGYIGYQYNTTSLFFDDESKSEGKPVQLFFLPYQCQSCKREPIFFIISRKGIKLQFVGRSQFENVNVPKYIPSEEKEFYSDAVVAYNTGRILASLYYLRALIEHYMRRILNNHGKITGEELGDQYSKLLDDEFPKKFTSLKTIYSELSDKLHNFEKNVGQFQKSIADIEKHFDLLQHFPIKKNE